MKLDFTAGVQNKKMECASKGVRQRAHPVQVSRAGAATPAWLRCLRFLAPSSQ